MKARPFGAWKARNVGPDGSRELVDGFNRALKGSERAPRAAEYPMQGIPAYTRYPMEKDLTAGQEEQKTAEQARKEQQAKNAERLRSNMVRQAVGMLAGAVVITSSYQTMVAKRASRELEPDPSAVVTEDTPTEVTIVATGCDWNDEDGTAVIVLLDSAGNEIRLPATVTFEDETFCTEAGTRTYTATATDEDGTEYTQTREEELPPTGHTPEETGSAAESAYICSVCGEEVERISVDVVPEG